MAMYTEIAKLSLPELQQGVAETIVTTDQLTGLLAFENIAPAIQKSYNAESSLGGSANSASIIAPDGSVTANSASYSNTTQNLTFFADSFNLNKNLATPNAVATEITIKSKKVARSIGKEIINGSITGNTYFNGLKVTVSGSSTQDICVSSVGSGSFNFTAFDQAIQAVKPSRPNLCVTNGAGIRYFKAALRTDGTNAEMLQLPNYGSSVLSYDGIPIITSDHIGSEDSGSASYYFIYTNEDDGARLWSNAEKMIGVTGPIDKTDSLSVNYTVGAALGFVIPSSLNVSRLYGVTS
ncbi:MAG: hypothetical protein WC306_03390 [Candidatus Paceibacterota bacterium]|jgi:hypothetical protein